MIKLQELRHIVLEQMGTRPSLKASEENLYSFLNYETACIEENEFNNYRDQIMEFIRENKGRLSLPCNGNCYEHTDATVLFCHKQLMEDM